MTQDGENHNHKTFTNTDAKAKSEINLKILFLNAENLFLLSEQTYESKHLELEESEWQKLSTSVFENKPLRKCKALATALLEENPDIILLSEVGGFESLVNFNQLFLNEKYSPVLVEGNSDRNIDVGFLIRKNMGIYFDIVSNKHRPINFLYPHERENLTASTNLMADKDHILSHKFSRDVAELHLFLHDKNKPFLIFLLTHLKSRLDPEGIDPKGQERRAAELKALLEIYNEIEKKQINYLTPIVVAGDFNGNASPKNTEVEFLPIYHDSQLKDVCALAGLSDEESATYYQVSRRSQVDGRQIDYCFLSPSAAKYLSSKSVKIYRYKNHLGQVFDSPTTLEAKSLLPSDHYPVVFELSGIPLVD